MESVKVSPLAMNHVVENKCASTVLAGMDRLGMITCRNGDNSACTKQFCFDCASWSGPGDGMEKCEKCDLLMCDECVCSDEGLINCYECCNSYCHACAVDETVIRGDELYCIECDPGADY